MSRIQAPDLLGGLRRSWLVVLVLALLGAAAGAGAALLIPDTYVSQAQVRLVHDSRLDLLEDEPADTYESVEEANRRMKSAAVSALSDDIIAATARDTGISQQEVRDQVTVEPLAGADLLVVSGQADDADTAVELARAVTDNLVDGTRESGRDQLLAGAEDLADQAEDLQAEQPAPVPEATTELIGQLTARALELRTRAALYEGQAELVTTAQRPESATAPDPVRGAGLGLAAGLLVGVAVALLRSMRPAHRPADGRPPAEPVGGA